MTTNIAHKKYLIDFYNLLTTYIYHIKNIVLFLLLLVVTGKLVILLQLELY